MPRPPPCLRVLLPALALALVLPSTRAQCDGKKTYGFTFSMRWTPAADAARPPSAEITHVVGVAHAHPYYPWAEGGQASAALAALVTTGETGAFESELDAKKREGAVADYVFGGKSRNAAVGDVKLQLTLDGEKNATHVTIFAGLRPSPGWFVGRVSFPLCDEIARQFMKENVEDTALHGYNSGLSEGKKYTDEFKKLAKQAEISVIKGIGVEQYGVMSMRQETASRKVRAAIGGSVVGGVLVLVALVACVMLKKRRNKAGVVPIPLDAVEDGRGREDIDW